MLYNAARSPILGDTDARRPPRAPENVAEALAPGPRPGHVARDGDDLVRENSSETERLDVLRQTVDDPLALRLEGAEEAVPHDEDAAVVPVDVLRIRPVVNAVMRRRVEDELDPPRQRSDHLGVN